MTPESRALEVAAKDGTRIIDYPSIDQGQTRAEPNRRIQEYNQAKALVRGERIQRTIRHVEDI